MTEQHNSHYFVFLLLVVLVARTFGKPLKANNNNLKVDKTATNQTTTNSTESANKTALNALKTTHDDVEGQPNLADWRSQVRHIPRDKREEKSKEIELPYDLETLHAPCDLDYMGTWYFRNLLPNHCVWIWNQRYVSEAYYRVYRLYQTEAFFFGQYHERMLRYETLPYVYEEVNKKTKS